MVGERCVLENDGAQIEKYVTQRCAKTYSLEQLHDFAMLENFIRITNMSFDRLSFLDGHLLRLGVHPLHPLQHANKLEPYVSNHIFGLAICKQIRPLCVRASFRQYENRRNVTNDTRSRTTFIGRSIKSLTMSLASTSKYF